MNRFTSQTLIYKKRRLSSFLWNWSSCNCISKSFNRDYTSIWTTLLCHICWKYLYSVSITWNRY